MSKEPVPLGKLIEGDESRDAVHVAIAPAIAGERLYPGQHIGLDSDGHASPRVKPIGIVDPFLEHSLVPDQKFWMLLYPNTITSLRHDWTHPAFAEKEIEKPDTVTSEAWLRDFAEDVDMSYSELIGAAQRWVSEGKYHILGHDTPNRVYTDREEFWRHYEIVTGMTVSPEDKESTFISCAC